MAEHITTPSRVISATAAFLSLLDQRQPATRPPEAYLSPTCSKLAWNSATQAERDRALQHPGSSQHCNSPKVRGSAKGRPSPSTIPRRKSWRAGVRQLPAALLAQNAGPPPIEVPPLEDLDMVVLQAGLAVDVSSR